MGTKHGAPAKRSGRLITRKSNFWNLPDPTLGATQNSCQLTRFPALFPHGIRVRVAATLQ